MAIANAIHSFFIGLSPFLNILHHIRSLCSSTHHLFLSLLHGLKMQENFGTSLPIGEKKQKKNSIAR